MTTLRELVESQSSIQTIIVRPQILSCMKNQDSMLKSIFTRENLSVIIDYIIDQQVILKGNEITQGSEISVAATEILCCECHIITDLLFSSQQQQTPLIQKLLGFLTMKQQYVLASFFSKVIIAITKRVFSPTHKYNKQFCQLIFEKGYLMNTLNHMYSYSMNQCVLKWFSLKSKGNDPAIKNQYYVQKKNFLLTALRRLNQQTISQYHVDIVTDLFTTLWNQTYKSNTVGEQLLRLVLDMEIINETLFVVEIKDFKTIKFGLLKEFIQRYTDAQKKKDQSNIQKLIYELVEVENIEGVFNWCMLCISNYHQGICRNNKVLLSTLELLLLIQKIQVTKDIIFSCYNDNASEIISSIVKTMKTGNNIIQLAQSKAVKHVIADFKCVNFGRKLLFEGIVQLIDDMSSREHVIAWSQIILNYPSQKQHIFESQQEEAQWEHVREIIQSEKSLQVGNYRLAPGYLGFTYSEQKAKIQFANFLNAPPVVVYAGATKSKKNLQQSNKKIEKQIIQNKQQIKVEPEIKNKQQTLDPLSQNQKPIFQSKNEELVSFDIENMEQKISNINISEQNQQAINDQSKIQAKSSEQQITNIELYKSGYLSYDVSDLMEDL